MYKLLITLIIAMILAVIGFALSGIVNTISQNSSTIIEKQKIIVIIVTWLRTIDTKMRGIPVINIRGEDF